VWLYFEIARACELESIMNPSPANPAAAFFTSPSARAVAALLRGLDRLAPPLSTRLAMGLFFTPLPTKRLARARRVPAPWQLSTQPFEGAHLALWRHAQALPGAPRVLLVHGWAGDAQQLRPLGDALVAAGYDPVLLDLPAHGRAGGWRTNLGQWVRALFAVSAQHGPWHAVVAHSLGAIASSHALARGLPAQRVALIALAPPPRLFLSWFSAAMGVGEGLAERMHLRIERRVGVAMGQFDPTWLAPRLHQPTLLLHDRADRTAPLVGSEQMAAQLPQGRLVVTEGLGHRRVLQDAEVLRQVLGHLGAH
jgi:pimeloyl-ACP methyl ester carboxylesterase